MLEVIICCKLREQEKITNEIINHIRKIFSWFLQQLKRQELRFFRLTNVDMETVSPRPTLVKQTSTYLVFMFSNFPIIFSHVLLRPFSVNHTLYLDTKLKHGPQKVITQVSTTAETINSFTVHLFLHFIEHSPPSYISVVWEIKSDPGLR